MQTRGTPVACVGGRYALYGEIASGGMATVHIGRLMGTAGFSRTVAIKRLLPQLARDPDFVSMFMDEARLVARIRHPNVVPTLDVLAADGQLLLVMEYVHGESLARLLRAIRTETKRVPPRIASSIVSGLLHGLHAAHEATSEEGAPLGIVHRDVSPQNVLVGTDGVSRVLDFGIAKAIGRAQTTREGNVKGKFAYMAPEQMSGAPVSRKTDVYAAAVVLWETLTGERLFDADSEAQLALRVMKGVTRPPSLSAIDVSPALDAVTMRGLAKDPAHRYASAREMALALESAMPPATAMEVGAWVESVAGPALSTRARAVSEVEKASSLRPPDVAELISQLDVSPKPVDPRTARPASPSGTPPVAVASTVRMPPLASSTPPPVNTQPSARGRRSGAGIVVALLATATTAAALAAVAYVVVARTHLLRSHDEVAAETTAAAVSGPGAAGAASAGGPGAGPGASASPNASAASAASVAATGPASCPEGMVSIPGGKFFMGADDGSSTERPAHKVVLAPYCLDKFEVTTADYKQCSDGGDCKRASTTNEWDGIADHDREAYDPLCNIRDSDAKGKHPINCVDWQMATDYCHAHGARLPTEAEWEFAARGPDGRRYPWGDEEPSGGRINACGAECVAWGKAHGVKLTAMYKSNDAFPATAPVGSFPDGKSRYGVYDVVGNVWEWVEDWYGPYGSTSSDKPPHDPSGPAEGTMRVIRGGGFNNSDSACVRPSFRFKQAPASRTYATGFRCAKSL
jgi:formylglycine-generating enzyme required for sulfatase activity/serine/threonine protein kinase